MSGPAHIASKMTSMEQSVLSVWSSRYPTRVMCFFLVASARTSNIVSSCLLRGWESLNSRRRGVIVGRSPAEQAAMRGDAVACDMLDDMLEVGSWGFCGGSILWVVVEKIRVV